jgi:hypothetical protein
MTSETQPVLTGTQMAAEAAANQMQVLQGEAHALHAAGDSAGAATKQEWSALAGGQPVYDAQGKRIPQLGNDYLVTHPTSGKTALFRAKPKDVMGIVHGRALEEDAARTQAAEAASERTGAGSTSKKLGGIAARLINK